MELWHWAVVGLAAAYGAYRGLKEGLQEAQDEAEQAAGVSFDPRAWIPVLLGDAALPAVDAFNRGDRAPLTQLLAPQNDQPRHELRALMLVHLVDRLELASTKSWAEAEADNPLAQLVFGARLVIHAWEARGSGWSDTVEDHQWAAFHERLEAAQSVLQRAADLDETDPTALAWLLSVGMGQQFPRDEMHALLDAALQRDPQCYAALGAWVQAGATKWGGDDQQVLSKMREASADAPSGSPIHSLLFSAHSEVFATLERDEGEEAAIAYTKRDDVRSELRQALNRLVTGDSASPVSLAARNSVLEWCYHADETEYLAEQLAAVGEALCFARQWGDPAVAYAYLRTLVAK